MAAFLALLTSALYGTGDFFGGLATKRNNAIAVLLIVQTTGMTGLAITMPLYGADFVWRDVGIGAAGGLVGLVGLALLYRGLARGPMSVVAPLTALTSALVPVLWGLVDGDRPGVVTSIGIAIGLIAIVVVSMERDRSDTPVTARVVVEALLAGASFGSFFSLLSETAEDGAPWPILGARVVSVSLLITVVLVRRVPVKVEHNRLVMVAGGLCDTFANVTFLFALEYGSLAPVAVLSSLYPAATVLWARLLLGEKLDRRRIIGLAAALVAVGLIAGG